MNYSLVVVRYARVPIYVRNPTGHQPMSKAWSDHINNPHSPELFEYGDFVGDPRHVLAIADNQTPPPAPAHIEGSD